MYSSSKFKCQINFNWNINLIEGCVTQSGMLKTNTSNISPQSNIRCLLYLLFSIVYTLTSNDILFEVVSGNATSHDILFEVVSGNVESNDILFEVVSGNVTSNDILFEVVSGNATSNDILFEVVSCKVTSNDILFEVVSGNVTFIFGKGIWCFNATFNNKSATVKPDETEP